MNYDYYNNPIIPDRCCLQEKQSDIEPQVDAEPKTNKHDVAAINSLIKENESFGNEYNKYRQISDELLQKQNEEILFLKEQIAEKEKQMNDFLAEYEKKVLTLEQKYLQPASKKTNSLIKKFQKK